MNGVNKFREALNMSRIYRKWLKMTCRKHLIEHKYLNGNIWPKIVTAPEPSLIMWNNFGKSQIKRDSCNNFISLIIFILILGGLYGMVIFKDYIEENMMIKCEEGDTPCEYTRQ